jgi:hypothetical protein
MHEKQDRQRLDRRRLLRGLGAGTGVAAAAVAAPLTATPVAAAESADERTKARYRETEHVKTYYETNRY